ncbi:hypothetical protein ACIOK4_42755 [Streptomyces bottropensis]|uniref:tetratricopeptide repeat protein n=1 Tax=Streptomyces bottropensis TaxID=42235 RepID=UPI003819E845
MTRLSREQKRELKRAGRAPAGLTPIDVRVCAETGATVGGMPVPPAAGESLQSAALGYLHRLALATGHPVLATVHDERIGYVVPLQVHVDGSSHYAGEPVRVGEPRGFAEAVAAGNPHRAAPEPSEQPAPAQPPRRDRSTHVLRAVPESAAAQPELPRGQAQLPHPAGQTPHAQPRPAAAHSPHQAQPEPPRQPEPDVHARQRADVRPEAQAQPQAPVQAQPQWQAPAGPDRSGHPGPDPQSPAPAPPKREPRTLPLSAAKPAPTAPPHAPEPTAVEATSDRSPAAPTAPQAKREPRTMPLTAAKEKREEPVKPVPGGVAPSTFVLRAVPEPTEGPLARPQAQAQAQAQVQAQAQPPRTPDLPLTLAGIPANPDSTPAAPEPTHEAAPATGTVSPPTGEFGPVMDMDADLSAPPTGTTATSWHPDQASITPPTTSPTTPRPAPASLEPQPWPPGQSPAPVGDVTRAPDAGTAPERIPAPPEPQPWTPEQRPAPDALASPEPGQASPDPLPWPAAPVDDPSPEPAYEPSAPRDSVPDSAPASLEPQPWPPTPPPLPPHAQASAPAPATESAPPAPAPVQESATDAYSAPEWRVLEEDSAPKPAPVREFDLVAEAVLETPEDGDSTSPFAEPLSRINEAVKLGRIQEAAEMAEQTVAQATVALGPHHPEVLKLRELTAYIAYLAGDALRSFHLSLDLAGLRHRLRDERAAYGNIQSAAAAWRAVRDPLQGLHLGRDLIAVWTDLAADAGPAADDLEQLEKARTRMTRLTERARVLDDSAPYAHGQ